MHRSEHVFNIRYAHLKDQKIIRSLLLGFKLPLDGLEKTKLWVLESSNGKVIGVAGLEVYGDQGLLRSLVVINSMHNQGYGTALANHVIEEAKTSDILGLVFVNHNCSRVFQGIRV